MHVATIAKISTKALRKESIIAPTMVIIPKDNHLITTSDLPIMNVVHSTMAVTTTVTTTTDITTTVAATITATTTTVTTTMPKVRTKR